MELITKYFPDLDADKVELLKKLMPLYEEWNAKINVISRKDMDQFYCNHVVHSLSIAKLYPFADGESVMDIGTGGGFPGIPLAILFPEVSFTLVDSIRKKTTVVKEVTAALGLTNVVVINDRFENLTTLHDVIVSRAVAPALKLVNFTKHTLAIGGKHILIKGGDLADEKTELLKKYKSMRWTETQLNTIFEEEFFETKKVILLKASV
jgi:16S rRNA (guanine527-N7)-methyltransferase